MSRSLVLALALILPDAAVAQSERVQSQPADRTLQLMSHATKLVAVDADGCLINQSRPDEIVVCANADPNRQHRLPFPELAIIPGERKSQLIPQGNAEIVQQGRCYVTMDERNCFKGVSIFKTNLGGIGKSATKNLWQEIKKSLPEEDAIYQVQIKKARLIN